MDPLEISYHRAAFFESDIFKHLAAGLDSVLKKCRQPYVPYTYARYHIVDTEGEKPKLGETMRFKECDNEDGSPCPEEERCFNPNFSAKNYLYKFLSDPDRFVTALEPTDLERYEFTTSINLYNVPNARRRLSWMTAFVNVFRDLFGQNPEE